MVDDFIDFYQGIMMPKVDGLDFLKNVKASENFKDKPFILVTAHPPKDYVVEAKTMGVSNFLVKPITNSKILAVMKSLCPDRRFKTAVR